MSITITRALAELKMIDKKIQAATMELTPIAIRKGKDSPRGFESVEAFGTQAKARMKKVEDLISREAALRNAVDASNSTTVVTIVSTEMTVSAAIKKKNEIIRLEGVQANLKRLYARAMEQEQLSNEKVQNNLDALLSAHFGKDSNNKPSEAEYEAISKPFMENNRISIVDPIGIQARIEALTEQIDGFTQEVDFVLSESNAKTSITVDV